MSQFQNIKFYTICRFKLKAKNSDIYSEIKSLFGNYVNRSQKDSVDKWIHEFTSASVNVRDTVFNYSRRNKYAFDNLTFDLTSTVESNSIQKKRFYALCRYKFESNLNQICNEINEIFYKDAVHVLNQWIVEGYKLSETSSNDTLKLVETHLNESDLQAKCVCLINSELKLKRELEQLEHALIILQNDKENLEKLNKKYEEDIGLAKTYWEQTIEKLNAELDELKQINSKLNCELYKSRERQDESDLIFKEYLRKIEQLNLNLKNSEDKYSRLAREYKSAKLSCCFKRRIRRTSKLIMLSRIRLREVYNCKYKYLMHQFDRQHDRNELVLEQIRREYSEKFIKLNEQLNCKNILYSNELTLKKEEMNVKLEKFDPSFGF